MVENWVKIEHIFRASGINFELRSWVYFCVIESRPFYYSPRTGKWRLKGKKVWYNSKNPEDFIAKALAYSPPGENSNSTTYHQHSSQQKISTKQKTDYYHSSSSEGNQLKTVETLHPQNQTINKTKTLLIPDHLAKEVELFVNLLQTGEIDSLSALLKKAKLSDKNQDNREKKKEINQQKNFGIDLHKFQKNELNNQSTSEVYLDENDLNILWNKVLLTLDSSENKVKFKPESNQLIHVKYVIEPYLTQVILKPESQLLSFDGHNATVRINNSHLLKLNQCKIPHLEAAFYKVTGTKVEVKLVVEDKYSTKPPPIPSTELEDKYSTKPPPIPSTELEDKSFGYKLTPDQEAALSQLKNFTYSSDKFFRLTGFAGTGKSFLITHYIQWLLSEEINFVAACPTNKAAKSLRNLAEIEGLDMEVKTVAQLLGQQPELDENTGKELFISQSDLDWSGYGIIIIDEFSMVSQEDFEDIANEINNSLLSSVVFVGDSAQLPPVGEKEPIVSTSSLIQQGATLTKVVRYDGELARVASTIRSNPKYSRFLYPFTTSSDQTILCLPSSEWLSKAHALFCSPQFKHNPNLIRFLAWRNKTVESLNNFVRSKLWGDFAPDYIPGDRLIARRPVFRVKPGVKGRNKWRIAINNSEEAQVVEPGQLCELLFKGQIYHYWKVMVAPDEGKPQHLVILHSDSLKLHQQQVEYFARKKQWSNFFDLSRMFDDIAYAYALTTHKAQGSTIDYVFLDVADMRGSSDRQKLQYTALTRARKQVLIPLEN